MRSRGRPLLIGALGLALLAGAVTLAGLWPESERKDPDVQMTAAVPARGAKLIGFNDTAVNAGELRPRDAASLAARAGATTVRVTVDWRAVEKTRGSVRLGLIDAIYRRALAAGQRPILVLLGAPPWALPAGAGCGRRGSCLYPPAAEHFADYAALARTLAQHYPQAAAIEVWNEPNLRSSWASGVDPRQYAALLRAAYAAVKSARPQMPVLGASLANAPEAGNEDAVGAASFLRALLKTGAGRAMDGLSLHPYPYSEDPWASYYLLTAARDLRDAAGLTTPLWITEVGASTSGPRAVSEVDQARLVDRLVRRYDEQPDVRAVVIHTLLEQKRFPARNIERGYGLLRPNLTPKPAFCVVAALARGPDPCAAGPPALGADEAERARTEDLLQSAVDAALEYKRGHKSYAGIDAAALHSDAKRLALVQAGTDRLLLCAASPARRSYCVYTTGPGIWSYGHADGSVQAAAKATVSGRSRTW